MTVCCQVQVHQIVAEIKEQKNPFKRKIHTIHFLCLEGKMCLRLQGEQPLTFFEQG